MTIEYKTLTPEQRTHFFEHGWIKVPGAISKERIDTWAENAFIRMGWDENDKSTWDAEAYHMPRHREERHEEHMPIGYAAASELAGGKERWHKELWVSSGDSLIVNVGSEATAGQRVHPKDSGNWHIDGDWFDHYFDSSDQGLLTVALYTDVVPDGGPTLICPKALPMVCKWMYEHPEGGWSNEILKDMLKDIPEEDYVYLTGEKGDVFFGHPFMPHSKSRNHLRRFRAICNPVLTLEEPFNYCRPDGDYSLLEQYALSAIGHPKGLKTPWKSVHPHRRFQPYTQGGRDAKVAKELERMKAHAEKTGGKVDSKYLTGERFDGQYLERYPKPERSVYAETSQPVKV
ncbi:hypothetical protein IAU59_004934 [Kwoniella sp. CBS 9459]